MYRNILHPSTEDLTPEAIADIRQAAIENGLLVLKLNEAEQKAWSSLAAYKMVMFGYWAGVWVHLNHLLPKPRPNPFRELVKIARLHRKLV
ncbi:hypothetical protein KKH23_10200 [Patescibacteria group bacterium]|nr:hypothetical protein [Patescibacteria group bacterium]